MDEALKLTRAFKEMRRGRGVNSAKLEARRWLLDDLVASTPEAGLAALQEIIADMGDGPIGNTMRASLGIGIPWIGNLEARRDWAAEASRSGSFFVGSRSTQTRIEKDEALPELVRRILERRDRLAGTGTVEEQIQEQTRQNFAEAGLVGAFTPANPIDTDAALQPLPPLSEDEIDHADAPEPLAPADHGRAGRRARLRAFYHEHLRQYLTTNPYPPKPLSRRDKSIIVGYIAIAATVIVLMAVGVIPTSLHHSSSAGIQPSTTIASPKENKSTTWAWGPDRTFYTMDKPAHSPVINSIADLPNYGSEKDFFICWDLTDPNANNGERGNLLSAEDQHTYRCQLLYDNGAASGFDHLPSPSQAVNPMAMLQNTHARVQFPDRSTTNAELWGFVSATNTYPTEVYDSVIFTSTKPVTLTYVTGSARLLIGGGVTPNGGAPLKDDAALTSNDGAFVGDQQDGFVDQTVGYIQFEVTVTLG